MLFTPQQIAQQRGYDAGEPDDQRAQVLIERLALALWNSLPYDHATCAPYCPTADDAKRALVAAIAKAAVEIVPA